MIGQPNDLVRKWKPKSMPDMGNTVIFTLLVLVGEKRELGTNQSVFSRAPVLFTKSANVWNKGLNWPVCAEFRCPKSIELS